MAHKLIFWAICYRLARIFILAGSISNGAFLHFLLFTFCNLMQLQSQSFFWKQEKNAWRKEVTQDGGRGAWLEAGNERKWSPEIFQLYLKNNKLGGGKLERKAKLRVKIMNSNYFDAKLRFAL